MIGINVVTSLLIVHDYQNLIKTSPKVSYKCSPIFSEINVDI